jgi:DNA-directed RNA polymerase III subunit RPC1
VVEILDHELALKRFYRECTQAYRDAIKAFVVEHVARQLADVRRNHGMSDALVSHGEFDADTALSLGDSGKQLTEKETPQYNQSLTAKDKAFVDNNYKITEDQLRSFLHLSWVKYVKARIEPGMYLFHLYIVLPSNFPQDQLWGPLAHSLSANPVHR